MIEIGDGDIPGAVSVDLHPVFDVKARGAAPVDVRTGSFHLLDILRPGFGPLVGKHQFRVAVAVEVGRGDPRRPERGQFRTIAGLEAGGTPPIDVRAPDAGVVVDVIAKNDVRIAVLVQIDDQRSAAAKSRESREPRLRTHQPECDLGERPFPPQCRQQRAKPLLGTPVDEGVDDFEYVMVAAEDRIVESVAVQVPFIDDLNAAFS